MKSSRHMMSRIGAAVGALLLLGAAAVAGSQQRAEPVPPYRLMYGYNDRARESWRETLNSVNIITGITTDGKFVQELRRSGTLFAYHVLSEAGGARTVEDTVREWEKPFLDDLGGSLPGGFDAIAIDEIGSRDGTEESRRVGDALRMLKRRYPDRKILAWGGWRMGDPGLINGFYEYQLRAIVDSVDLLLYEMYLAEARPRIERIAASARYFNQFDPKLLSRTVYALYLSQTKPFVADNDERVDYQGLLNLQVALLRSNDLLKHSAGIGFWAFYRARQDTVHYVNQLLEHYFLQGNTRDFGDALRSPVDNAGFEDGMAGWSVQPGGTVEVRAYRQQQSLPSDHGGVSHRRKFLSMRRGERIDRVWQRVSLAPSTWYVLSALAFEDGPGGGMTAYDSAGRDLGGMSGSSKRWSPWRQSLLTFLTDASGKTIVELNDADALPETVISWDFVEITRCTGSNRPPVVAALCKVGGRLVLFGSNFIPGGKVTLGSLVVQSTVWLDAGRIDLGEAAAWPAESYETVYRKPETCLQPHEATGLLRVMEGALP